MSPDRGDEARDILLSTALTGGPAKKWKRGDRVCFRSGTTVRHVLDVSKRGARVLLVEDPRIWYRAEVFDVAPTPEKKWKAGDRVCFAHDLTRIFTIDTVFKAEEPNIALKEIVGLFAPHLFVEAPALDTGRME